MSIEQKYIITYSNHFIFEGRILSFRKKELFDVTENRPKYVKRSDQGWWVGKKLLTITNAKQLIRNEPKEVDISDLQWYIQEQLNHVFNLENL